MVEVQLRWRGIQDAAVLAAMAEIPRHRFVPPDLTFLAYTNQPLPIGYEQTISQPYIVAFMLEAAGLAADQRVLEIGTGSGYQAAVLSKLVSEVYTIEIIPALAKRSKQILRLLGCDNVQVKTGDGHQGWPDSAPFDAILVAAAPESVPLPLLEQLSPKGRAVIPIGTASQDLVIYQNTPTGVVQKRSLPVRFVPMTSHTQ